MKQKKIPLRSCVVTKEKLPKRDLIRIVKDNTDKVVIDLTGKTNGRGAYLKKDLEVIRKAKKSKVLDRHLAICVKECIYDELEVILDEEQA